MNANHLIAPRIQAFFQDFLVAQRGLSSHTIAAYRDCIKLFLNFAAGRLAKPVDKLTVEDFQDKLVVAFLDNLETSRGNSTRTRNARLAALHALFRYIAGQQPEAMARCQQICALPAKRTTHNTIEYLEGNRSGGHAAFRRPPRASAVGSNEGAGSLRSAAAHARVT